MNRVAVVAANPAFGNRVVVLEGEFRPHSLMAGVTHLPVSLEDFPLGSVGFRVQAAWPVAGFAAFGFPLLFEDAHAVAGALEVMRDFLVTCGAHLVADILRAGNHRGHHRDMLHRRARDDEN